MLYFCTCKKCKSSSRNNQGRYLKTKKTYKKHQNAELLKQNTSDNNSSSNDTNLTKSNEYNDNDMEIESDKENLNDEERDSSDEQIPMFEIFQNIINSSR